MKLTERERPTVGWHLPPEIWTQIFTLIVREEIARMSRKLCEKDFNRRTKTTFRELPACYVLSRVCRNWHGTVRDLVENAKWTRFHYAAFWNDGQDEPFFFPQGPITLDKVENLQLTTGSSHVEQLLSMVPNVRRLIFSKTPPNAFFEAASKHCPAVHHITQSQDELFPSPQLDPGVLKTALSRWHSAGFGGVRQLELDSDLVVDDDLLTSIISMGGFGRYYSHPEWNLSADAFNTLVDWIGQWEEEWDWSKLILPVTGGNDFAERMLAFARTPKPKMKSLTFMALRGQEGRKLTRDGLLGGLMACPNLLELSISQARFDLANEIFDDLWPTLRDHNPDLRKLTIHYARGSPPSTFALSDAAASIISELPKLSNITLNFWPDMKVSQLWSLLRLPSTVDNRLVTIYIDRRSGYGCPPSLIFDLLQAVLPAPKDSLFRENTQLQFKLWTTPFSQDDEENEAAAEELLPLVKAVNEKFANERIFCSLERLPYWTLIIEKRLFGEAKYQQTRGCGVRPLVADVAVEAVLLGAVD